MKTKKQLIKECRDANPTMIQTINGIEVELIGADYDKVCSDWADMRLIQLTIEAEAEAKEAAKATAQAKLAALGITVEDITALGL
jgi:hypothetical protein